MNLCCLGKDFFEASGFFGSLWLSKVGKEGVLSDDEPP